MLNWLKKKFNLPAPAEYRLEPATQLNWFALSRYHPESKQYIHVCYVRSKEEAEKIIEHIKRPALFLEGPKS